jgi:hypothetical protein
VKRKGDHREVVSEGSVEQRCEPTNRNRIPRHLDRTSQREMTKSISIKGRRRKSGGCALKGIELTPGDLTCCFERGTGVDARRRIACPGVSRGHIRWRH